MLLKYHLTAALLVLLFSLSASAQFRQNIYYLKNDDTQVSTKDSADFTRIITAQDSDQKVFEIKEYYKNGNIKLLGQTTYINYKFLTGLCRSFYISGKKQRVATYKGNAMIDEVYDFFPNGNLYTLKRYPHTPGATDRNMMGDEQIKYTVITSQDSTGKILVNDSSGYYINYNANFSRIREEGKVTFGKKTGVWKGIGNERDSILNFVENYSNNILIDGTSTGLNGKAYKYSKREIEPEFNGGDKAFNRFLATTVRYPKIAKENGVQGRVFITFLIENDGALSHFQIVRDPGSGLGDECLRVLKLSPNWKPAFRYGHLSPVPYTVPVNFSLAG